jgi:uncharacterized protein
MSFTHLVLFGALVSAGAGVAVLAVMRVVTGRRPGGFEVLEAVAVSGAVAMIQFLMVSDGFGKLHVAYLWVFVSLPIIGAVVLMAAAVPALRPQRWGAIAGAGLLALAVVGLYATYVEPRWIRTERVALDVAPVEGGDELRIGVLSDLQTDGIGTYEYDAVDRLMAEEPDVILVPGDFFQSDGRDFEAALPELRALLGRLEAPGGVFVTEGDVDSPERMAFMSNGLENLRWLDDEIVTTEVRGVPVHIGGISVRFRDPSAQATIDELGRIDDGELRILLSHRPDAAFHVSERGADLVVAGHTHGGQVAIPFIGPPITMSNVSRSIAAGGLHEIDGIPIYLSNGVGLERASAPQVRFNSRPSVGIVTLT